MPYRNPEATRCTALKGNGQFCDGDPLPDAPFPICVKHAARIMTYLNERIPQDRTVLIARALDQGRAVEAARKPPIRGYVYYIRIGDLIKIGYSENLSRRLGAYPPDAILLATEIGTRSLEAQRHREFAADLRRRNEWFAPSPALLAHIERVAAKAA